MPLSQHELREIISRFIVYGDFLVGTPFGNGNINDTYQLTFDQGAQRLHYALQRINSNVFTNPKKVMENVDRVTAHILKKIRLAHMETQKRTLRFLRTEDGNSYVRDDNGNYWRAYVFVERARTYDTLSNPDLAYKVAQAFGEFQADLIDLDSKLHETIPNFHNTPKRLRDLEAAVRNDRAGRASKVQREIDFALSYKDDVNLLVDLQALGEIPERTTHNDAKVNNVLMDDLTGKGICVIDLDTVMPGLSLYDFGDMVRSGANSAEEDEVNLARVFLRYDIYEALHRGFMSSAGGFLTNTEKELMPFAAKLITLEIGVRFLADYLDGDIYFKTRRPEHNIERARNQFRLVQSIESQYDKMMTLVKTVNHKMFTTS